MSSPYTVMFFLAIVALVIGIVSLMEKKSDIGLGIFCIILSIMFVIGTVSMYKNNETNNNKTNHECVCKICGKVMSLETNTTE